MAGVSLLSSSCLFYHERVILATQRCLASGVFVGRYTSMYKNVLSSCHLTTNTTSMHCDEVFLSLIYVSNNLFVEYSNTGSWTIF